MERYFQRSQTRSGNLSFLPKILRILIILSAWVSGIFGVNNAFSQAPSVLAPEPGSNNTVLPILQKPFVGDFEVTNLLDHDVPQQFVDANGIQKTYWGGQTVFLDGHQGYDFSMPVGTPLLAAADGKIIFAGVVPSFFCPPLNQIVAGLWVIIRHVATNGEIFDIDAGHLSRVDVQIGDSVLAGQQIGLSGNSGCSTAPHLHFQVLRHNDTNNGQPTIIDPYGWEGNGADPWAQDPQGAQSLWLWKPGQAPSLFREVKFAPDGGPVAVTVLRWMGWKDYEHPNNEFVELTLNEQLAPLGVQDMTGFRLRNNRQKEFQFPAGFQIFANNPVRIYIGSGTNTATELYWGQSRGVWDDMGDCAHLVYPAAAGEYLLSSGPDCNYKPRLNNLVDFDGDGKSDVGIYRDGVWSIRRSSDGRATVVSLGGATDIPVPADYDGDGLADAATYLNGLWSIQGSSDGVITFVAFGGAEFIPVPADYDGDGKADVAVYAEGVWSILRSSDSSNKVVAHGGPAWTPVPADYDGDGKADVAVYFAGAWSIIRSSDNGNTVVPHGGASWTPMPADYDGDGKADICVHFSGAWSIINSSTSTIRVVGHGGGPIDIPLN